MRTAVVLAGAVLVAATGCGGNQSSSEASRQSQPAPQLSPPRVTGEIPGRPSRGPFFDEDGRSVADVHALTAVGQGRRRVELLFGRLAGVPCIGARAPGTDEPLHCLERWENPPVFVRLVVGGDVRARTDWLAVVAVARDPAVAVSMQSQSGDTQTLELRSWPSFEWRAFAVTTERGNLANSLRVTDQHGEAVAVVSPSWAYEASPTDSPWAEVRDPIAAASGADETAHPIVFRNSAIRRLVAGHTFVLNPTAGWDKCNGEKFGAVVSMRFSPPVEFKGEIPIREYAGDDEDVAYREGRAYVEAKGITTVEAWVDLNRRRVVGIDLEAFDDAGAELEETDGSTTDIGTWDVVEEPRPAGGPDDADACPKHEFGD